MKIAILWSTGFIGKYLVQYFSHMHHIVAFWRKNSPFLPEVEYEKWDLHFQYSWDSLFDLCIDCACDTDYEKSNGELLRNNVDSLQHIHIFLEKAQCSRYIYISSSSVYMWESGILTEGININTGNLINSYALSKYLAEEYIRWNISQTIPSIILRPRAIYGEGDTTLFPRIISQSVFSYLLLPGDGCSRTSILSIENLAHGIETILDFTPATSYEILNIADESDFSYAEIYSWISEKYGFSWYIRIPRYLFFFLIKISRNKWSYILDNCYKDKILNISKIRKLWYNPKWNIESFLRQ